MSFIRITGEAIDGRSLPKHTWNADLVEFDGPLLSLFKSDRGDDVLYAWLDCTETRHRWCIIPVTRKNLRGYLAQKLSLLELFKLADSLVIFHATDALKRSGFIRTDWERLPTEYLPAADSFLTSEISTEAAKRLISEETEDYYLGLDGDELYIDDLAQIPKIYQQLYSFHYGLEHLGRAAVRGTLARLASKWTGGFSAVHIFSGLKSVTPSIHRARVSELRFNSPGHIKLDLLTDLAERIEVAALSLLNEDRHFAFEIFYKKVYRYFKDNKLSGFDDERVVAAENLSPEVSEQLSAYVADFFGLMAWDDYRAGFESVDANPLQQLRVLLAYYRRLNKLRPYLLQGKLFLGTSRLVT